jgi:hypothetical protein
MIATLSYAMAGQIATRLRHCGWLDCKTPDVLHVWTYGTHDNEALASAILQAFATLELTA